MLIQLQWPLCISSVPNMWIDNLLTWALMRHYFFFWPQKKKIIIIILGVNFSNAPPNIAASCWKIFDINIFFDMRLVVSYPPPHTHRQSGTNTRFEISSFTSNRCGCYIELRPFLELKIGGLYLHWGGLLMEQCNFQAVELTHISLCGTNLPVMNLPGRCGASTTEPAFFFWLWWRSIVAIVGPPF